MAHRLAAFLVVVFVGSRCAWADSAPPCALALEQLVARAGSAQIEAPLSSDAPLALAAMGRLTVNGRAYSVWRIRNGWTTPRDIVLRSTDGASSGSLTVAPHSDLFVRSEDVRSAHRLLADGAELHRLSPLTSAWHDARFVPDPLCSEPGTTLWVQHATGLLRVSPIDGQILFEIPTHTPAAVFALDPVDGSVWIWDFPQLMHVGLSGVSRAETLGSQFQALAVLSNEPARLPAVPRAAVDDAHRLWIALGHQLLMASPVRSLTAVATLDYRPLQLVFDRVARLLWLASESRISAWPIGQAESAPLAPAASWRSPALRQIAADAHDGGVWVLAGPHLSNYDALGQLRVERMPGGAPPYLVAAGDPSGGIWLAGPSRLTHFSESAVSDVNAAGALLPRDLSLDLHAGTLWLSTPERILEYSEAGVPLVPFGKRPGDSFVPAAGAVSIASRLIKGVQSFADRNAPLIRFLSPDAEAPINLKRPPLTLQASDREGHIVVQSIMLSINDSDSDLSCSPASEQAIQCNLSEDLPEGQVMLRVSIADDSGNVSSAERTLRIDTVPPAPPASSRIHVLSAIDGTTLKGDAGAVEAAAQVMIFNARTGARVQVMAAEDGSFVAMFAAASGDSLQIIVGDAARNISAPIDIIVPSAEARLEVLEPLNGLVTSLRDLTVRGSLSFDGGVAVNGHPASLTRSPDGWEFRTRIPLAPGQNVIDVVAHPMDGAEIRVTRSVSLQDPQPFGIRISSQSGLVPLTVRFSVNEYASQQVASVSFDFEGNGITTEGDPGLAQSHTYAAAGHYVAVITVDSEDGSRYRYEVPVTAIATDELDDRLQALWRQFIASLGSPDPASAARFMEPPLASSMNASFLDLGAKLPSIVSAFSQPVLTNASTTLAEYIVTREIGGSTRAFAIYFRLGADGIWRLASL